MLEFDVLNTAIAKFKETTDGELQPILNGKGIQLILKIEDYDVKFDVKVVQSISKSSVSILKSQLTSSQDLLLLVTRYVNPGLMEILKNLNINFIDTAGNAFIKLPPLYINIQGKRLKEPESVIKSGRAFQPAGLQLIFTLLCNPRLEENPLREIAEYSGVGLTTVQKTLKGLEKQGFLAFQSNKKYKLINKGSLIKRWTVLYPEKLKPKYFVGRFKADNNNVFDIKDIINMGAQWGGETAASMLTNYIRPAFHTVYVDSNKTGEFLLRNRLRKDPAGNIEIVNRFWNFNPDYDPSSIVHPILIYADLIAMGDQRDIETANIIYERKIAGLI